MGVFHLVLTVGSVAKMPHQHFTGKGQIFNRPANILYYSGRLFFRLIKIFSNGLKQIINGRWINRSQTVKVLETRRDVELNTGNPRTSYNFV